MSIMKRRESPSALNTELEGVLACLNSDHIRARLIIKSTSRDASVDVSAIGGTISLAYEVLLPDSVKSVAPLTSAIKKQEVQGTAASRLPSPAPSHSRREACKALLPFIEPSSPIMKTQLEVHSTTDLRSLSQGHYLGRLTTGRVRPIGSSSRQGALCAPSEPVLQSRNQGRGVPRLFVPITRHHQRVENMPMLPYAKGLRVVISLPETDNAETARAIHPPSVKLSSAPKSLIPRYIPKNKVVVTKTPVSSDYAATVRPPSQKRPRPFTKAGHPATKGSRSRGASSKEVELPKVSSQALCRRAGGRPVTNDSKALVKAPSIRPNPRGVKRPVICKSAPEDIALPPRHAVPVFQAAAPLASSPVGAPRPSRHESVVSGQPPAFTGCRIRRSPFRPRRRGQDSRMKIPPKDFLTSTPRKPFSSPLSPPHIYADVIAHTHTPNNPAARIACFQGCGIRGALERLDIELGHGATMRGDSSTRTPSSDILTSTLRGDSCTPSRDILTSTLHGSFSLSLSPPRIHAEVIAHLHSPNSPTASIGRRRREWSDIDLDHDITMDRSRDPEFLTSTPQGSFSLPLSPPRIYGGGVMVHTHAQDSPTSMGYIRCFLGCGLRAIINLDVRYVPGQDSYTR